MSSSRPRYNIRQGDQYPLRFQLRDRDGNILSNDPTKVLDVSITLGSFNKKYSDNELTYDSTNQCWEFLVTQQDSLNFSVTNQPLLIRVKLIGNNVVSTELNPIAILQNSMDREVL